MKLITITYLFVLTSLLPTTLSAQTEVSSSTASTTESGGIFSNILQNVGELGQGVREQIQGERNVLLEKRDQERITNLAANISNRFDGIIARLQNIIDRLGKRIEKQSSLGYDVGNARQSLQASQDALNEAKSLMNGIDETVADALGSTDPKSEWQAVRVKFISARDAIRRSHPALRDTVANLKDAPPNTTTEASSTEPIVTN